MTPSFWLRDRISGLDRRTYAVLIGISLGVLGGLVGLALATAGPIITIGGVLGILIGLYVLTNISAALYGVVAAMALLPFGTMPFRIGFTPTLLDVATGAFLLVYLLEWMTGQRRRLQLTLVHALVVIYAAWLVLSFILGMRHAAPTLSVINQFAQTLLSIGLVFVIVDLLRTPAALRRLVLVVMVAVGIQALMAVTLYALPDELAERTLIRLARIGYPDGGVIRYIEDNPALDERAIGTWVDPNALGGVLAVSGSMIAPQIFARRPVLRYRWLSFAVLGVVVVALLLTFSRASMLAFVIGVGFIALFRPYRRFIPILLLAGITLLFVPQTREYLERFIAAFTASDLSTQMRLGEYSDSLRLISRYPVLGVGFTGTPAIDLYTDVASMYLIMANQIGLTGLLIFIITIGSVFAYGRTAWRAAHANPDIASIHLGYHAALLTAMLNATADLYFFRLDFQASITLFWLVVALALSSSHQALRAGENQPLPNEAD